MSESIATFNAELNPLPDNTPHNIIIIRRAIQNILHTTSLYSEEIHNYIACRYMIGNTKPHMESYNNIFMISQDEFNEASRLLSTNTRLLTILSMSYYMRFPFSYQELPHSLPLCILTIALLWNNLSTGTKVEG